jgi:serine/threonine-protein kinase HipA
MTTSTTSEIFVHARWPDGTSDVVGRYRLTRDRLDRNIGEFRYAGSWLANRHGRSFPLDPVNLPLLPETFFTTRRGGLFGPLADTTPDRWGQRLLRLTHRGPVSPCDWLLATGDDRVGCLAFSPSTQPPPAAPCFLPFGTRSQIADAFDRIIRGEDADPKLAALYRAGQSLGGVRPKAVVEHAGHLWIAKFQRHDDDIDQCAAEHATMRLAATCDIQTAETELVEVGGGRRAVFVKRFDRGGAPGFQPTAHFISALSLLDLDETSMEGSYLQIAAVLRQHGSAHLGDREELFRRMLFNVLCGNRDDHLKNHALLHDGSGWRLSPAFDIVPQTGMVEPVQAIAVGALGGMPTIENCVSRCGELGLSKDAAEAIVDSMVERMRNWPDMFRVHGVPETTIARLRSAFAPILSGEDNRAAR